MPDNKSLAPALERGLTIIQMVSKKNSLSFSEISKEMNINVSSLNRVIKVLLEKEFLTKDERGHYTLGSSALALATSQNNQIEKLLFNFMQHVSDKYEICISLYQFIGLASCVIKRVANPHNLAMREEQTIMNDLILSPWGTIGLNEYSSKEQAIIIARERKEYTGDLHLPSKEDIQESLSFYHKHGYCDDFGKIMDNERRIAIPLNPSFFSSLTIIGIGSFIQLLPEEKIKTIYTEIKAFNTSFASLLH